MNTVGGRNRSVYSRSASIPTRYPQNSIPITRLCALIYESGDGEAQSCVVPGDVPGHWQRDHCNITIMYEPQNNEKEQARLEVLTGTALFKTDTQ